MIFESLDLLLHFAYQVFRRSSVCVYAVQPGFIRGEEDGDL